MGLAPMTLFVACALVVRNLAVANAFEQCQRDAERRAAAGLSPRTRRRRRWRWTLANLFGASANAPPRLPNGESHQFDSRRLSTTCAATDQHRRDANSGWC